MRDLVGSPFTGNVFARQTPARLKAARKSDHLNPLLARVIRRQAMGNWLLPSLAVVTPQYIETILRGALGGNHVQQWELFDLMEDTWPRLAKNLGEIKDAVAAMDWKLEAWAEEDQPPTDTAIERKQLISAAVWEMNPAPDRDDNAFEQTISDILDAGGKGVSVLEMIWEHRNVGKLGEFAVPQCTSWVHPSNYAWHEDGFLGLNPSREVNTGVFQERASQVEPFPENKFLIAINKAKSGSPLTAARLRPLAWWWCAANFSADWLMNLAQLFGLPFRWATFATDAEDDTIEEINDLLANMGSNGYGAFPEGTSLEFLEGGKNSGASPQDGLLDRADKACDLLILRQTLTTDAPTQGGTQALGRVHKGVRDQVIQSWANFAARVLNTQLIPAILRENFGEIDEAPYFCPEFETEKDLKATAELIKSAVDTGLEVPKKWAHSELKIPLPQKGEEIIERAAAPNPNEQQPNNPPNHQGGPQANQSATRAAEDNADALEASEALTLEQRYVLSVAEKTDPVLGLINRIANIKDDTAMLAALQNLYREMPALTALVTADVTRQQRALEQITAPALVAGLQGKQP
jgi:phage gp29-like protein